MGEAMLTQEMRSCTDLGSSAYLAWLAFPADSTAWQLPSWMLSQLDIRTPAPRGEAGWAWHAGSGPRMEATPCQVVVATAAAAEGIPAGQQQSQQRRRWRHQQQR
jgi:hypothetical protein